MGYKKQDILTKKALMENITVAKLEKILSMTPEEVGIKSGWKRSGIYKVRKNYPERYKKLLLGVRLYDSPLKIKEILDLITPTEKIVLSLKR